MTQLKGAVGAGTVYLVEVVDAQGRVTDSELVHNLIPDEGVNHVAGVVFKSAAQVPAWYIALFEGNYTPVATDTAASMPGNATECTAYTSTTRVEFNEGNVNAGAVDNSASRAEFLFNADKTVYGGWLVSSPAKGATTGVALSIVKFSSPKVVESGSLLRVTAGVMFASV